MVEMTVDQPALIAKPAWYAVSTRSRHEKTATSILDGLGIVSFLPLVSLERQWSDRKKMVAMPLFPGYIFVQIAGSAELRVRVLKVPGVVSFVGNQNGPLAVPEREIDSVRAVVSLGEGYYPHPFLKAGDRVRVVRGPLAGIEGTLLRCGGQSRLVISVEMIQRSVSVEVAAADVEPVQHMPEQEPHELFVLRSAPPQSASAPFESLADEP